VQTAEIRTKRDLSLFPGGVNAIGAEIRSRHLGELAHFLVEAEADHDADEAAYPERVRQTIY